MYSTRELYLKALETMEPEQIDHHESDLYIMVTPESKKLISDYEYKFNVETFVSAIAPHVLWYDIPFAYSPYWDFERIRRGKICVHLSNIRKG